MKIQSVCLMAVLALASVVPAAAQDSDVAYCHALAGKYQEYLAHGSGGRHGGVDQNADARMAIDKCNAGDTSGIPTLEHALQDAKIELPNRG